MSNIYSRIVMLERPRNPARLAMGTTVTRVYRASCASSSSLCLLDIGQKARPESAHLREIHYLSLLRVSSIPCQSNSNSAGDVLHSTLPHLLIQLCVNTNVLGAHYFLCELSNLLQSLRRPLLKSSAMNSLMEVDCILPRHNLSRARLILSLLGRLR